MKLLITLLLSSILAFAATTIKGTISCEPKSKNCNEPQCMIQIEGVDSEVEITASNEVAKTILGNIEGANEAGKVKGLFVRSLENVETFTLYDEVLNAEYEITPVDASTTNELLDL